MSTPPVLRVEISYDSRPRPGLQKQTSTISGLRGSAREESGSSRVSGTPSTTNRLASSADGEGGSRDSRARDTSERPGLLKPTLDPKWIRFCPQDRWVPEAPVMNCMAPDCSTSFSLFNRKHRCRMCGCIFCSSSCANTLYVPVETALAAAQGTAFSTGAAQGASASASPSSVARAGETGAGEGGLGGGTVAGSSMDTSPASIYRSGGAVPVSVCNACSYEAQLVVSSRQENGEPRRKSRGEFKMFQRALVINILTFLTLKELSVVSVLSSDFYFMSRDNLIWYQYNMARWVKDASRQSQLTTSIMQSSSITRKRKTYNTSKTVFRDAGVVRDATALTETEAAKRVISLHARYSYTQFLDFVRRQEMARCEGISSFSVGARLLLASPIKIAIIGPSGVGKTASVRAFAGSATDASAPLHPTMGFSRFKQVVHLSGGVVSEATLHIYDISGDARYEQLRRLICRNCHAVGLCYDPMRKVTLVQAADVMLGVEAALGPQPVVVCGLLPEAGGKGCSGRAAATTASVTVNRGLSLGSGAGQSRGGAGGGTNLVELEQPSKMDMEISLPIPLDETATVSAPVADSAAASVTHAQSSQNADLDLAASALVSPPSNSARVSAGASAAGLSAQGVEVTTEDAKGITVRGRGSLHCPRDDTAPFYNKIVQCLLDRLSLATVASTATLADIREEMKGAARPQQPKPNANSLVAQELLNITMQPSVLDILLDRK